MEPLDLTVHIPRSSREELDGLAMLPRTIDKARASLPSGDLGPYHLIRGQSALLLKALGVEIDDFVEAVRNAKSDEDVGAWLRTKTDPQRYPEITKRILNATQDDISAEGRPRFESLYSPEMRAKHHNLCDLMEADDRELERERAGITG